MLRVPVVDKQGAPLMPTHPNRAARWVQSGRATPFWSRGVWCIRLNDEPSGRHTQSVAIGIDPGSKREGITVASEAHCYLNIQAAALTWVKDHVETRRQMRRGRRYRKCPYRQPRANRRRTHSFVPPSTKARWQWKLRLVRWLMRLFPISHISVEDVQAVTKKGARRWNVMFSPLEVGKQWFYEQLEALGTVLFVVQGYEVAETRRALGLTKSSDKLAERWEAHCVDSWTLTRLALGGTEQPDHKSLLCVVPLRFHRRRLHLLQPTKGGIRRPDGGTRSLGFTRGSLVRHPRYGLTYVGGSSKERISLHALATGKRLTQMAKIEDCRFRCFSSWRFYRPPFLPTAKPGASWELQGERSASDA